MFKDNNVEEGYPRPISDFSLPPGGVDAAFSWAHNDRTYFFKDQRYWRYDDHTRRMDPGYPAQSPLWRGVPSTLDDAMRWSDGERRPGPYDFSLLKREPQGGGAAQSRCVSRPGTQRCEAICPLSSPVHWPSSCWLPTAHTAAPTTGLATQPHRSPAAGL